MLKRIKIESSDFESPFEIEFSKVTLITGEYNARPKLLSFLVDFMDHLSESSFVLGRGQEVVLEAQIFDWTYVLENSPSEMREYLQVGEKIYRRHDDLILLPDGSVKKLVPNASSVVSILGAFPAYPEAAKIRRFASWTKTVDFESERPDAMESSLDYLGSVLSDDYPLICAYELGNGLFGWEVDELVRLLNMRDFQIIATTASLSLLRKTDANIVVVGMSNGRIVHDKRAAVSILAERGWLKAKAEGRLLSEDEVLEEVRQNRGG